jgi:hypothetical protein
MQQVEFNPALFGQALVSGRVNIIKDFSQRRGGVYDSDSGLWESSYDRLQVLLCELNGFPFILRTFLYNESGAFQKEIMKLDAAYTKYNALSDNFMKYYGKYLCFHRDGINRSIRKGLRENLNNSLYCRATGATSFKNTLLFFQYLDTDMTLLEAIHSNALTPAELYKIFYRAAFLLIEAYRRHGFIHGDLNLRNVLIKDKKEAYFVDFDDSSIGVDNEDKFIDDLFMFRDRISALLSTAEREVLEQSFSRLDLRAMADWNEIMPGLILGGIDAAKSLRSSVSTMICMCPEGRPRPGTKDEHLPMDPSFSDAENKDKQEKAIQLLLASYTGDSTQPVMVYCFEGVSRSASVVVGFVARYKGISIEDALALVKSKRPKVNINKRYYDLLFSQ